jgi:hypothetical protein
VLSPRRDHQVGLHRRDAVLRMPMVDPEKKEIVERVARRGGRASSPCIRLCKAMKRPRKSCGSCPVKTYRVHPVFVCVRVCVPSSELATVTVSECRRRR